jgi:hypothetical protein
LIRDLFNRLQDGLYEIEVLKGTYAWRGRYRYYFGYLMTTIITDLNLQTVEEQTGEVRPMSTEELHELCKKKYNPIRVKDPFTKRKKVMPGSTTSLSDGEFIQRYEEEIASFFATEYGLELLTRNEWVEKRKTEHE